MIEQFFLPLENQMFGRNNWDFVQDNAPLHTGHFTQEMVPKSSPGGLARLLSERPNLSTIRKGFVGLKPLVDIVVYPQSVDFIDARVLIRKKNKQNCFPFLLPAE